MAVKGDRDVLAVFTFEHTSATTKAAPQGLLAAVVAAPQGLLAVVVAAPQGLLVVVVAVLQGLSGALEKMIGCTESHQWRPPCKANVEEGKFSMYKAR